MAWWQLLIEVLSAIIMMIPLVVKLVQYVELATKEKNWGNMLRLVTDLMATAEDKFDKGADRREWVLMMVESSAKTLNYNIDLEQIGKLIDDLCAFSKTIN